MQASNDRFVNPGQWKQTVTMVSIDAPGMPPEAKAMMQQAMGEAQVREVFKISKVGTIAGCFVSDGKVNRSAQVRVLRDNVVIHTGKVSSLKRFKDDASEVKAGLECGIGIAGYNDVKPGDVIEFFTTERVKDTLT